MHPMYYTTYNNLIKIYITRDKREIDVQNHKRLSVSCTSYIEIVCIIYFSLHH